jgi:hypothetical protein
LIEGRAFDVRGGEGLNLREALKIVFVECQYIADPVNLHDGHQARIVNDDSLNGVTYDQPPPFLMGCKILRQELAKALNHFGLPFPLYRR